MNSKFKELASAFNTYARQLLQEQEAILKSAKDDHVLSGKLARIKVFTEHLEISKEKMQHNIDETLRASASLLPGQYSKLEMTFKGIYAECINDYMYISFIKGKD